MRGSVKQDKKRGTWTYVCDIKTTNGKRKQKRKRGFSTEKEARKALIEFLYQQQNEEYVEPSKMSYKDYIHTVWLETKQHELSEQTIQVYRDYLKARILPEIGTIRLSKLTIHHIQQFINYLNKDGLKPKTVKKIHEIIRSSLQFAVKHEYITKNVATKVTLPIMRKPTILVWGDKAIKTFLNVAKHDPLSVVFQLAIFSGMRQGEILGLQWKYVNFDEGTVEVCQTLSQRGGHLIKSVKTDTSRRTIALPQHTMQLLKKNKHKQRLNKLYYGKMYQENDLVCCTKHGTPLNPSNVRRTLKRLIKESGVPEITFHALRHTHATWLLHQGVNIKVIQERLGHSNVKITLDIYTHVQKSMQQEAVDKLESFHI